MTRALRAPRIEVVDGDISEETLNRLARSGRVALDTETTGLDWRTDTLHLIQIASQDDDRVVALRPQAEVPYRLLALLAKSEVEKVFHHACFDLRFLYQRWSCTATTVACTKVLAKILKPQASPETYSLRSLVLDYCGVDLDKAMQQSDWTTPVLSAAQLSYAVNDVWHLIQLRERLAAEVVSRDLESLVDASFAYIPARVRLDLMEAGDVFTH